ncbi:glycoside hydrolase family 2 TIM barrel-domain containing protein [Hymenobacter sp. HDW8]|uniref:glycoside hydrolase family 2 TIM barrel-domain containing protein n=1 Tax=Hymenobacter sp. HDW8 TaxID=2714932 RepID=UPI001408DCA7|nr:glycoside hydrolase family 2 TIM barrel-domain containing protein [Hymenobacter sp. HDW8]QIL74581.1 hypothetical protein G7064_00920 [Hymenobacter sp. HDW8]
MQQLDRVKELGGNSVRLYTTNYADAIMDKAHAQGLTVMLGLWMKPEYEDFDYYDRRAVALQNEEIRRQVLRFRNHPALLMWNVGNELDNHTNNPRAFQILNDVVKMIHELDPYHPVTTTMTSSLHMVTAVERFCPDLDVLTVNVFSQMGRIRSHLVGNGWTGPYILGEYGARGWWVGEAPKTKWRAPLDQSSNTKAEYIRTRYEKTMVGDKDYCLGGYILYWGQRFEQTSMWFSLFTQSGDKTAVVDMIHYLWTGKSMPNKAPSLRSMRLAGKSPLRNTFLRAGNTYEATVVASDPEGDSLDIKWEVVPDVNENFILPQHRTARESLPAAILQAKGARALVKAPTKKGPYRLLVTANDGHGSVATHSYPFYVGEFTAADLEAITQGTFKKKAPGIH